MKEIAIDFARRVGLLPKSDTQNVCEKNNSQANESGVILDAPGYESLARVLTRAFHQAAHGKGKERHAQDLPFEEQPMQTICHLYGTGFALGQAAKKAQEAQRLPHDAAVRELLGGIIYLAGAVIAMERGEANA